MTRQERVAVQRSAQKRCRARKRFRVVKKGHKMNWLSWLLKVELKCVGVAANEVLDSERIQSLARQLYEEKWLNSDFSPSEHDKKAAWDFYVEVRTRITTESLHYRSGDEATALASVATLFGFTRDALHKQQAECRHFAILATGMLNGVVRPFTAKWHKCQKAGAFRTEDNCHEFRNELKQLQVKLRWFQAVLGTLAEGDKFIPGTETARLTQEDEEQQSAESDGTTNSQLWWLPVAKDRKRDFLSYLSKRAKKNSRETKGGEKLVLKLRAKIDFPDRIDLKKQRMIEGAESAEIRKRRRAARQLYDGLAVDSDDLVGLAISGGGIRSATFALGVVQRLAHAGLLREVDYLSTVSGGGYIGSFLSSYLNSPKPPDTTNAEEVGLDCGQLPFGSADQTESKAVRWLRNRSKYLVFGGAIRHLQLLGLAIYGVVINVFLMVPIVASAAWLTSITYGDQLRKLAYAETRPAYPATDWLSCPLYGSVCIAAIITLILAPTQMWCHRSAKWWKRIPQNCIEYVGTWVVPIVLLSAVMNLIPIVVWYVHHFTLSNYINFDSTYLITAGVTAAVPVISAIAAFATKQRKIAGVLTKLSVAISVPTFFVMLYLLLVEGLVVRVELLDDGRNWLKLLTILPAIYGFWFVNVNLLAPHRFYRNRLADAYQIQADAKLASGHFHETWANRIHSIDAQKLSKLRHNNLAAPYHLINAAVNLPGSTEPDLRGRNADFFLFSQRYCGSPMTGYESTVEYEKRDTQMDLGTAIAISAAAAAPQMGMKTVNWATGLMTMLNVRLSYWAANPGAVGWRTILRGIAPANALCLLRELFGVMHEKSARINLSDGGHIENLGVYELLRRRCRFIVAIDGEQDTTLDCPSLHVLIRHAAIDLNADIRFPDLHDFKLNDNGWSRAHFALGIVRYKPRQNGTQREHDIGFILYIKNSVTGNEPSSVLEYRRLNPSFPHQTTADQFFNEDQFEAYRALGYHAVSEALRKEIVVDANLPKMEIRDWFKHLVKNLLPD